MPTYEYECPSGHRYEKREGFDAPSTQKCPTCKKTARRVLFAPPIVFKGSGFYVTDSRGSGATSSPSADAGGDGGGEGAESAAKPEPSSEAKTETPEKADTAAASS